jgi:hypothetical protein
MIVCEKCDDGIAIDMGLLVVCIGTRIDAPHSLLFDRNVKIQLY